MSHYPLNIHGDLNDSALDVSPEVSPIKQRFGKKKKKGKMFIKRAAGAKQLAQLDQEQEPMTADMMSPEPMVEQPPVEVEPFTSFNVQPLTIINDHDDVDVVN